MIITTVPINPIRIRIYKSDDKLSEYKIYINEDFRYRLTSYNHALIEGAYWTVQSRFGENTALGNYHTKQEAIQAIKDSIEIKFDIEDIEEEE